MNEALRSSYKHKEICPLDTTIEIFNGKWKSIIICRLMNKNLHFNELNRSIINCSKRMLAIQLKKLIKDDIVNKNVIVKNKDKVAIIYSLSELGNTLVPIIKEMDKWGEHYIKTVKNN
ncbi:winged helix-turn-helix transcriptional regulator [Apilactobacillus quenuiae]|uniref:winged helix-turn-helix transcriptional regulator n=1 Tax=Apilactobacillus quenuiae TaxID=2008377 RepID=UPI001CDA9B60|nr:helix-turn-helix domain-containing protein [Apilactobacillus quenuiae]